MEGRKRDSTGRFARVVEERETEEAEESQVEGATAVTKAPRPRYCRVYVRARLAKELPDIVDKLIEQAKGGSVPHMALLLKTAGMDNKDELVPPAMKKPEKSLAAILMEGWEREKSK